MTDSRYNGWTNYATWRVNLEIFDGSDWSEATEANLGSYELGQILKDYAQTLIFESGGGNGNLAVDYALAFLSDVNWREIAQHLIDEHVNA